LREHTPGGREPWGQLGARHLQRITEGGEGMGTAGIPRAVARGRLGKLVINKTQYHTVDNRLAIQRIQKKYCRWNQY